MRVRPAETRDCQLILDWRNEDYVRRMSRHTEFIDPQSHAEWFARSIRSADRQILMVERQRAPFAMVRFDRLRDNDWEVSIIVGGQCRGKGLAREGLQDAIGHFQASHRPESLIAVINVVNGPSLRLFESLSFGHLVTDGEWLRYRLCPVSDAFAPRTNC